MTKGYFAVAALEWGFVLVGDADTVICDRQDPFALSLANLGAVWETDAGLKPRVPIKTGVDRRTQ